MRLFLSSYGLSNQPERLFALLGENKRVALVTNASDYHDEAGILERVEKDKAMFAEFGLTLERFDLRDYFADSSSLETDLTKFGLIWVRGGNAFVLRRAMAQSSFDKAIKKLLSVDALVYGGYSAGACVLSPTLHGVDLCDDPTVVPPSYNKEILWDGLNMINFGIAPHYKSDHPESDLIDRVVEYFEHHHMSYEALKDGEAIVIEGDIQERLS